MSGMTTITIRETDTPSRSKGRGWAYVEVDGRRVFATKEGATVEALVGSTVKVVTGVTLRRSTRETKDRDVYTATVSEDPTEGYDISIGSPQAYKSAIRGVCTLDEV